MANLTKRALMSTLLELLNEKPLDKITVREIVDACGVSRNTFYYHFRDIYELVEAMLSNEVERILRESNDSRSLSWVFCEVCQLSTQHSKAISNLYRSSDHNRVVTYLHKAATVAVRQVVLRSAEGLNIAESDIELISNIFAAAVESVVTDTIRGDLHGKEDADALVKRASQLLDGAIELTIVNASRNWNNPVYVGYTYVDDPKD